jgi:ribose 1,5-bisphosphokinase
VAVLFYVIGASGVGKDSLLNYARARAGVDIPVLFAHRYITRPAKAGGENHVALSRTEFACMKSLGLFALSWESHGLCYGLGLEIDEWLARGAHVVMNGSRAHLGEASRRYPDLCVILIEASPEVLRARLEARGRESKEEIAERIARATAFEVDHPNLIRLRNDGELAEAGDRLLAVLGADLRATAVSATE